MKSKWYEVWNRCNYDTNQLTKLDFKNKITELKRLDGFDVFEGTLSYESFYMQYKTTKEMLIDKLEKRTDFNKKINSVFEVGCGSGANLLMFEKDGYKTGGIDFSKPLLDIAKFVLNSNDLICDEAIKLNETDEYDVILSNSVFSYFPDFVYAENVLNKCLNKAKYSIGLLDIHDYEKKDAFIDFRKKEIRNYEEKYKDLPKLFYKRDFFENFAKKNKMEILFSTSNISGYWNNNFIFNVFMYKNID